MAKSRLTKEIRAKELRLAMNRIRRGRSRTGATKLSISAVAREANVSAALIHNLHPDVAEAIRAEQGRSSRAQRDAKHQELKDQLEKNAMLRAENEALRQQVARLASLNEMLVIEQRTLRALVKTDLGPPGI